MQVIIHRLEGAWPLLLRAALPQLGLDDHRDSGLYLRSRTCGFEGAETMKIPEGGETEILLSHSIQLRGTDIPNTWLK